MTTTRTRRSLMALVALAVALSMTWSLAGPATAGHPFDRVPTARHRILGQHLTNHHTHMETWIVGWYPFQRSVRIHHHWRNKTFYGLRVSAQHCDARHCWGRVVAGKLRSPHQPGRPVRRAGRTDGSAAPVARGDLCIQGTVACAAPWNWFARYVDRRQQTLVRLFIDPCANGSIAGSGVVVAKNLSARIFFEGGLLTAARAASAFEGPPGVALGALAGCMTGVGAQGFQTVKGLLDHLNPFGRRAGRRG